MRSDELLVLALVRQGLSTKYELRERAGLSLGSSSPVLERLEKARLIRIYEEGARRSRRYEITEKGIKELERNWSSLLRERPDDIDSILRIAYLAWVNGDTRSCTEFMRKSAELLRGSAVSRAAEGERLGALVDGIAEPGTFRWMRTRCDALRVQAEVDALRDLAAKIEKKNKKTNNKSIQRNRTG